MQSKRSSIHTVYVSLCCTCHMAAVMLCYHHVAASVRVITLRFYFPFLLLLLSFVLSFVFFFFYFFIFLLLFSVLVHSCHNSLLSEMMSFIFHISFHLLFSLVSFSLFRIVSVIAPSTLTFTSIIICCCLVHFVYMWILFFFLLPLLLSFQLSICELSFICISFFFWSSVHFPFSIPFCLSRSSVRSFTRSLPFHQWFFFIFNNFTHPQTEQNRTEQNTMRECERESKKYRASYIFIPRWSIPHIKYSVFGAFLPFIIVIVCMVILS